MKRPRILFICGLVIIHNTLFAAQSFGNDDLTLDPPAGKRGFVKEVNGQLYFEDGSPARFKGTDLFFSACLPSHNEADTLAGDLSSRGCNAVRLRQRHPAIELDDEQYDRLDYLIWRMKERGIYINLNIVVLPKDPKLFEIQLQSSGDLLSHYNKYTKLKYCNDPAIAIIEVSDYMHFFAERKIDIATADNLATEPAKWSIASQQGASLTKDMVEGQAILNIEKITSVPWHIQYKYDRIAINKGKTYLLRFTAKATEKTLIQVVCQQGFPPWENLGLSEKMELSDDYAAYSRAFTANADCPNSKVSFILGYKTGKVIFKDISFEQTDIRDYFDRIESYLRFKADVKAPIIRELIFDGGLIKRR